MGTSSICSVTTATHKGICTQVLLTLITVFDKAMLFVGGNKLGSLSPLA